MKKSVAVKIVVSNLLIVHHTNLLTIIFQKQTVKLSSAVEWLIHSLDLNRIKLVLGGLKKYCFPQYSSKYCHTLDSFLKTTNLPTYYGFS